MLRFVLSPFRRLFGDEFGLGPSSVNVILWILRGCFFAIMIGIGWIAFQFFAREDQGDWVGGTLAFVAIMGAAFLVVTTDLLVRNKQITTISAVYFGLLMGLLMGSLLSMALGYAPESFCTELSWHTVYTISVQKSGDVHAHSMATFDNSSLAKLV